MNPLQPHTTLTVKLGSAIVHAEEFIETGEPLDRAAFQGILDDPEFKEWRRKMESMSLLPVKR